MRLHHVAIRSSQQRATNSSLRYIETPPWRQAHASRQHIWPLVAALTHDISLHPFNIYLLAYTDALQSVPDHLHGCSGVATLRRGTQALHAIRCTFIQNISEVAALGSSKLQTTVLRDNDVSRSSLIAFQEFLKRVCALAQNPTHKTCLCHPIGVASRTDTRSRVCDLNFSAAT